MPQSPFDLSAVPKILHWPLRQIGRLDDLETWYGEWKANPDSQKDDPALFLDFVLKKIGREYEIVNSEEESKKIIPSKGPLMISANHPLGALEGMVLARLLLKYRPDLKVLTNEILLRFPEFKPLFIGVNILSKKRDNRKPLQEVNDHLTNGGAILMFPSGTVSHLDAKTRQIVDPQWRPTVAKLAMSHNAPCLPVHIQGRNRYRFYITGWVSKILRTMMLPRAMLEKGVTPVKVTLGTPVSLSELGDVSPRVATDYLRMLTELTGSGKNYPKPKKKQKKTAQQPIHPIAAPDSLDYLNEYEIFRKGDRAVFCVPYDKLGPMQDHLASEREKTFRSAGEGSGKALDMDRFDREYQHLIAWDYEKHQLIGAYRACKVDDALKQGGRKKLYSNSLFDYSDDFLKRFSGAIEVGRSFITEAYQRDPRALDLLWQGLGALMIKNPDCHTFIGCVSISNNYAFMVKSLLHDALLAGYRLDNPEHKDIKPNRRFKSHMPELSPELLESLGDVGAINKLFGNAGLAVRVPVLIRQYLALNGRFVDFAINKSFSNSLDGLIIVDLRQAPQRYIKRYLGKQGGEQFNQQWGVKDVA